MKRLILAVVALLLTSISINAQTPIHSYLEYRGGSFYQNGQKIEKERLCSILGEQAYDKYYKPANALRITGITLLSVGGAAIASCAGLTIAGIIETKNNNVETGQSQLTLLGSAIGLGGAVIATGGGICLGAGNRRMKKITYSSYGAGLALVF